jgi:hypothetical protein
MKQRTSWAANRSSANQEIPCILWNPKVHYHNQKALVACAYPNPQQSSSLPHPTSWRSISILYSHLCLWIPSCSFQQVNPSKPYMHLSFSAIHATCPAHSIIFWFDHPYDIQWGVKSKKLFVLSLSSEWKLRLIKQQSWQMSENTVCKEKGGSEHLKEKTESIFSQCRFIMIRFLFQFYCWF